MNDFSSPCSDMPLEANPRVPPEAREYYERSGKTSQNWFAQNGCPDPKPEARLRSDAAQANAMKNRGSMSDNMKGYANPVPQRTVHPRAVKGEAQGIAQSNKGGGMKNLIENYGNLSIDPQPAPKVAEKHRGEQMGPLMRLEGSKTPREPKVGRLHQTSTGSGWDEIPPQHRMRPEGEGFAQKNSADTINDIILQTNTPPERKDPKVLKHMTESDSPSSTPAQRVRLDGIKNLEKANNREEMSAIMHGSPGPQQQQRPTSGKRVLPHLKRSELW